MIKNSRVQISESRFKINLNDGFSLIEMLVTVFVFALVAIVATQSLTNSLRSSTKTKATQDVRENLDFSLSTIERLLRNAKSLDCTSSTASKLIYKDEYGNAANFELKVSSTDTTDVYIASQSGSISQRLTSYDVMIDSSQPIFTDITCPISYPHSVDISLKAKARGASGSEGAEYQVSTKILLRNYY